MLKAPRKFTIALYILAAIAILSYTSVMLTLAQTSNTTTATIVGQANVNGVATNGVTVNIGSKSATTSSYNGVDGVYVITGLPTGTSLPLSATYQGQTYTDTIDPLTAGQQYYEIPAFNIAASPVTATPTAAPNATVTPTPSANATVTPTPAANATVTPTPAANASVTPTPTITPTPTATPEATAAPTPAPAAPAQTTGESSPPPAAPEPVPAQITPAPTDIVDQMSLKDPTATVNPMGVGTTTPEPLPSPVPEPTTARSPGFAAALAISCLLGAGYLAMRKGR